MGKIQLNFNKSSKLSWVCGGSKGIGYGIAQELHSRGENLAISSKSGVYIEPNSKLVGDNTLHFKGNLLNREVLFSHAEQIQQKGFKIDRIFCTVHTPMKPINLADITVEVINEQVKGAVGVFLNIFQGIEAGLFPHLDTIIGFSSVTVYKGGLDFIHRNMAKGALEALIRGSGQMFSSNGIKVFGISIGYTDTPQLKRYLKKRKTGDTFDGKISSALKVAKFAIKLSEESNSIENGQIVQFNN